MTSAAFTEAMPKTAVDWHSDEMKARRKRRYAADRRLQIYGIVAISFALGFLAILIGTLSFSGYKAFTQTVATIEIDLAGAKVDPNNINDGDWRGIVRKALRAQVPGLARSDERKFFEMFTSSGQFLVRDAVVADPSRLNRASRFTIPMADPVDQLAKGEISRDTPENQRRINDKQIAMFDQLVEKGVISTPFNWGLFFNADSRFPELAGLAGAISGSFWSLLVCFLISFPIGIAAAIYLEEFAPKNRLTDIIEVNINNLAAVPSVVFGLLGLAVFLGFFGLPRSAPLVGGLVLTLMTLPTIIIATRAALKAVPPSIREAALGVGASKHQVMLHHVLPLAMPGMLTGTIIGMARALGESAPLLMIGMVAFIVDVPDSPLSPATALPVQV
ncbi:MAG TPA: PstA family ABC transporter permease, partial [Sinorhizobium sp.]|nr:PstA family ABC transporter permease [Sinorhizobium sp.]